jgi:fatty acid desaturase
MVGSRQHGMAILMHEAAHRTLFKSKGLNDFVGQYILAAPYGGDMEGYRHYHLKHHRYAQTENDPDLPLSAKFPVSKASLKRKFLRDITGQTFLRLRLATFRKTKMEGNDAFKTGSPWATVLTNALLFAVFTLLGFWWAYFALWLAPLMTWFMFVLRLRNIAEHAMTEDDATPLRQARTTHANVIARIFLAPYWVNYHIEHHAYMFVPCYRLKALHLALAKEGHNKKMILSSSYSQVLKTVSTG